MFGIVISVAEVFDYWAHASAIDIGEDMSAPDNFESSAKVRMKSDGVVIIMAVSRGDVGDDEGSSGSGDYRSEDWWWWWLCRRT